jgi:DNA-directed RNA polymerase subunit F
MTEKDLISQLSHLSIEQLDAVHNKLLQLINDQKAERERLTKLPPRTSNDLEALAEMQDLDLRSLLKDAKRYS